MRKRFSTSTVAYFLLVKNALAATNRKSGFSKLQTCHFNFFEKLPKNFFEKKKLGNLL